MPTPLNIIINTWWSNVISRNFVRIHTETLSCFFRRAFCLNQFCVAITYVYNALWKKTTQSFCVYLISCIDMDLILHFTCFYISDQTVWTIVKLIKCINIVFTYSCLVHGVTVTLWAQSVLSHSYPNCFKSRMFKYLRTIYIYDSVCFKIPRVTKKNT